MKRTPVDNFQCPCSGRPGFGHAGKRPAKAPIEALFDKEGVVHRGIDIASESLRVDQCRSAAPHGRGGRLRLECSPQLIASRPDRLIEG